MQIRHLSVPGYERVVSGGDEAARYHGIVFIHSTALGPAVGGTRLWSYQSEQDAITDGLRLSRGMTYKNALAGLPCGGGKSIIIRPDGDFDREKLFRAHGRLVESAGGKYITAEDVGTSPADMECVRQETNHVAGLQGKSGDPSPKTARGVFRAIQACAQHRWGRDDLKGKTVAIQGCGHVGYFLAGELARAGAKLVVADVDQSKVDRVVREFGATTVGPNEILAAKVDVLAPCALGGIINDETIPRLQAEVIAGGANNQLLEPQHGDELEQRKILYAPDYAANGGGVINGCCREMLGWDEAATNAKIDAIYETILNIFKLAEQGHIPSYQAADRLAEERLAQAVR
ncbi:MAG TPA: Glu/Leu/Phe/Val dehydrogenase [Candidatus Angelobacter sp.]|jgi:leucine dehydrogenase|nr:Glu/Leu/Phe/Val dehydrogenase [Candidatus Angelobacter sp.]